MTLDEKSIDKRVVRRNLERGRVDADSYRRMLESLPDRSANAQRVDATPEPPATSERPRPAEPSAPPAAAAAEPSEHDLPAPAQS